MTGCVPGYWARQMVLTLAVSLIASASAAARTEIVLSGSDIASRVYTGSSLIFHQSDSLFLNHRLLERNVDYVFDSRRAAFDLSRLSFGESDTLRVVYDAVPSWLKSFYGTPLPEVAPSESTTRSEPPNLRRVTGRSAGTDMNITGAKTFRFTTRSAGASNFSQSLDLSLSGKLTSGLELTGTISDRGYDPSYGTANSRLNELDKLNLSLSSKLFTAQVGDIVLGERFLGSPDSKRVSGASFALSDKSGHFNAAVARPKGRFETASFLGRDNTQGPYQIASGTAATPVVPGSESVWLDGAKLERGTNKDYSMDYPTGRITFNVAHPIDSRSRIEIDYEPLLTGYRGELFSTGGGVSLSDSAVSVDVRWIREGDDKDEPFTGELTSEELDSLGAVGDRVELAVRSGVNLDSLGSYVVVVDSLPDSVYQYVGEGDGEYSVTFSFVGRGLGEYQFLGGSQYRYVGDSNGDYLPVVVIPAPERVDYYQSRIGVRGVLFTELSAELRQTQYDRNLLSNLDDDDNDGLFYALLSRQEWMLHGKKNEVSASARKKEARFKTRQRLYDADFNRNYFLPFGFQSAGDETKHDLEATITPLPDLSVSPFYSRLEYDGSFRSNTGGVKLIYSPSQKYRVSAGWHATKTELDSLAAVRNGDANIYNAGLSYSPGTGIGFSSEYERDSRTNEYSGDLRGTRYHQVRSSLRNRTEQLTHEYFAEDSLTAQWSRQLRRNRLTGSSIRKFNRLTYSTLVTYQWLERTTFDENSLLSRVAVNYNDSRRQLAVGASYVISEETRNGRGVTYLEVERGEGDYIKEDNEFVPDPDGNFIRVEETLSEISRVSRGEKSFHLNKTWSGLLIRLNSNIEEELLPEGSRKLWWAVPFLSDRQQPYLFYSRRYNADLRLYPIRSGHAVNFSYTENREIRSVADIPRRRDDFKGVVIFKQALRKAFFDQQVELFKNDRDSYYSGSGNIDGYRLSMNYRQTVGSSEVSTGVSYRDARSDDEGDSKIYAVIAGSRIQVLRKGELRSSVELYHQNFENLSGTPSFLLTDNRPGSDGAIWSLALRYGIRGGMRVNFSISGRHSDDRTARVTGRGEFVAGF